MAAVVAVDVGSTSARAGVFPAEGSCLARATAAFAVHRPLPHHAEHSSDDIWRAVCTAVRQAVQSSGVDPATIAGLAFDATCSLVVLDPQGSPVTVSTTQDDHWNVVMWADHRATEEAREITGTGHRALRYVGGVMSPEMELPKLVWLKRRMRSSWDRMGLALDLADFLAWRATGSVAVSACTVTCKWAYLNHERTGWQSDLLEAIGLDHFRARTGAPERATQVGTPLGGLTARAAAELGLPASCVLAAGLIDAHAGGLGLLGGRGPAALNAGLALIAGTSNCHMAVAPEPRFVQGVWGPYAGAMLPDAWLNEGGQSATGALLDHILDWHAEGRALGREGHAVVTQRILELQGRDGPGLAGGLRVRPDFNGNRSPLARPDATGRIDGLTLDASFDSLARLYYATASGIGLGTRHIIEVLNQSGYAIDTLYLAGGHLGSEMLVQLYADATGCMVVVPADQDSVLAGTAALARAGCGLDRSLGSSLHQADRAERHWAPRPEYARFFAAEYVQFLAMHA